MKPEQFFREQSLDKAREVVASIPVPQVNFYSLDKNTFLELPEEYDPSVYLKANYKVYVSVKGLKRLVESVDRVMQRGGLSKTKDHLDYLISFGSEFAGVSKEEIKELQQDVANYESIYGGVDE